MNATSMMLLAVDEMPAQFKGREKNGKRQPIQNRWTHKVRFYGPQAQVKAYRASATIEGIGDDPGHPYYADERGLVGFLDYYVEQDGKDTVLHIGYMNTRNDYMKQGVASQLADYVIRWVNPQVIEWGEVMQDAAQKIVVKARERYPSIRQYAKGFR